MDTSQQLIELLINKFGNGNNWCQGTWALNEVSQGVYPGSRGARRWCVSGFIEAADFSKETKSRVEEALRKVAGCPIPTYNDKIDWKGLQKWLKAAQKKLGP